MPYGSAYAGAGQQGGQGDTGGGVRTWGDWWAGWNPFAGMKRNVDNMWAEADARAAQMTQIGDMSRVENDTPLQFELPLPPSGVKVVQDLSMTSVTFTAMAAGMATAAKFKVPISGTGKERAADVPSWVTGHRPYVGEDGKTFANV